MTMHKFYPKGALSCFVCGYGPQNEIHFTRDEGKTLVLGRVIDRYPRMLGLLKAAEPHLTTLNAIDVRREIQALLKEIEQ